MRERERLGRKAEGEKSRQKMTVHIKKQEILEFEIE